MRHSPKLGGLVWLVTLYAFGQTYAFSCGYPEALNGRLVTLQRGRRDYAIQVGK